MDDKKVKYDALDAMWAFVRMGGYQLHPADISSLKDHCEQLRHLLTQKTAGQRRGISERRGGENLMRVENMTDREIVAACAVDFRRKAQEAHDAYQSTGMTRYDNAYHKYEALADALDRDVQKADTRQAAASLKSELIMLASAASRAKLPSAPEGALLALAKEVIAVGRLYGYDGKEMDA